MEKERTYLDGVRCNIERQEFYEMFFRRISERHNKFFCEKAGKLGFKKLGGEND